MTTEQVQAAPVTPPPRVYSVADFGGVPDWQRPCDDAVAAALAKMKADDTPGAAARPCKLVFPAGDWWVRRPVWLDRDRMSVAGEGVGITTLSMLGAGPGGPINCAPVLLAGIAQDPVGTTFDPAARKVDLFRVLDAKAAPKPGVRWGLRTDPAWHVATWAGPLAHGANCWTDAKVLTVAFALDNGGKVAAGGLLFGMEGPDTGPGPWRVWVGEPGTYYLDAILASPDGTYRTLRWSIPGGTAGLDRVIFQIDVEAGTCLGFLNGKRVAKPAAGAAVPGRRLAANNRAPFLIGGRGRSLQSTSASTRPPRTFCGLWAGGAAVYRDEADLARIDGKPVDDLGTFFDPAAPCLACLPMTDGPAAGRTLTYLSGPVAGFPGYILNCWGLWMPSVGPTTRTGLAIRDLSVNGGYAWGQPICLGCLYNVDIRDVDSQGGWHGIGSAPIAVTYPVDLRDVTCRGHDAGYFGYLQIVHAQRITIPFALRTAMRFEGSSVSLRGLFVGQQPKGEYFLVCHAGGTGGGQYIFEDVQLDNEGQSAPTIAAVLCEAGPYLPQRLALKDWGVGTMGKDAVFLLLKDNGPEVAWHRDARVSAERITATTSFKAVCCTDGKIWYGTVERPAWSEKTPGNLHLGPGESRVKVIDP